ncbi:jg8356 [Pararge aegeria aegeria]|uniref:Jg8356 protein n=1 Tax=Pararge aegeria aegeria TaxID=348720 RepID=A0A8S4SDB2_9NEOP|nr:jg8356 [Pararge aegeria aegeria]
MYVNKQLKWKGLQRLINPNDFNSVTRACWRASEWGSARKSLIPKAQRSEGIVGLRSPHVGPNLGSREDWREGDYPAHLRGHGVSQRPDDVRRRGPRLRRLRRCANFARERHRKEGEEHHHQLDLSEKI